MYQTFESFKEKERKTYETYYEELYRRVLYEKNVGVIEEHNRNESRSFDMVVNQFADLSEEEFLAVYAKL